MHSKHRWHCTRVACSLSGYKPGIRGRLIPLEKWIIVTGIWSPYFTLKRYPDVKLSTSTTNCSSLQWCIMQRNIRNQEGACTCTCFYVYWAVNESFYIILVLTGWLILHLMNFLCLYESLSVKVENPYQRCLIFFFILCCVMANFDFCKLRKWSAFLTRCIILPNVFHPLVLSYWQSEGVCRCSSDVHT